jgi:hypothetical protein
MTTVEIEAGVAAFGEDASGNHGNAFAHHDALKTRAGTIKDKKDL